MRPLLRLLQTASAARLACIGVLAAAGWTGAAAVSSAAPGPAVRGGCSGATVTREYTAESMTYRLHLDLDGCRWWDGSPRNLVIWLSRDDGTGAADRYSMTPCSSGSDPTVAPTTTCEVAITLPHPGTENAVTYQGEATWEWKDGTHRASFDKRCTTTTGGSATCTTAPRRTA